MSGSPVLIGLPYDASSSFLRGAAEAPAPIRVALHSPAGNTWTELGVDLSAPGALGDAGDVAIATGQEGRAQIETAIAQLLDRGLRPIALGGDHSVTYPIRAPWRDDRAGTMSPAMDSDQRKWTDAGLNAAVREALDEGLAASALWSLLLGVIERRARQKSPSAVLQQWKQDRFVRPCDIDQRTLNELDADLLAVAESFKHWNCRRSRRSAPARRSR